MSAGSWGSGLYSLIAWENDGSPFDGAWNSQSIGAYYAQALSIDLGDVDDDGDLDVVAGFSINSYGSPAWIVLWQNDGTPFSGLWTSNQVGVGPNSVNGVEFGDLDNDGDLDIVSGSRYSEDYEVIAWENDGTPFSGLWTSNEAGMTSDDFSGITTVALGDLNRDGYLDIVGGDGDGMVKRWQNDGTPFSGSWWSYNVGDQYGMILDVTTGDMNGDGVPEIVATSTPHSFGYSVTVWYLNGSSWDEKSAGNSSQYVNAVALGDLDGDGDPDIVWGVGDDTVRATLNARSWSVSWDRDTVGTAGDSVSSVALGDLDGDGDLDIVSGSYAPDADYEVMAWENEWVHRHAPLAGGVTISESGVNASSLVASDVDRDGDLDFLLGAVGAADELWLGAGNGGFVQGAMPGWSGADDTRALALGDLDGDARLDLVKGLNGAADEVWLGDGDGSFIQVATPGWTGSSYTRVLALGDLDDDGRNDLVTGRDSAADEVWLGDGDGSFTQVVGPGWTGAGNTRALALADLNGDARLDLVIGLNGAPDEVWLGYGDGSFTQLVSPGWTSFGNTVALALADLNADARPDLVVGLAGAPDEVWLGDGDGSFTQVLSPGWMDATNTLALALGDLNGDGTPDLVMGLYGAPDSAWLGNGDGTFSPLATPYWPSADTLALLLGDFDWDGDEDMIASTTSISAEVFKNTSGQASLLVSDISPPGNVGIGNDQETAMYNVLFRHNGVSDDRELALDRFYLTVNGCDCSTSLTDPEINAIIDQALVRLDDGDGVFESDGSDVLVATVDTFALESGRQPIDFGANDANVRLAPTTEKRYWISLLTTTDAASYYPNSFCLRFDPDADALVEARPSYWNSVSLEDTEATSTVVSIPHRIFVQAGGSGAGASWADAGADLQAALTAAAPQTEVWVAAGVYTPGAAGDRTASFQLKNGVGLYGGFSASEACREPRSWQAQVTVLSGDIDGDDLDGDGNGIAETVADIQGANAYHVVSGSSADFTAVLDGFIVTAGSATGSSPHDRGGGMTMSSGDANVRYAIFRGNRASTGGGMYVEQSHATLSHVTFQQNWAEFGGGMLHSLNSRVALDDVIFSQNTSQLSGGGLYSVGTGPSLTDVLFYDNDGGNAGGGMYNLDGDPQIANTIFDRNSAYAGGGLRTVDGQPTLANTVFSANTATLGGALYNDNSDTALVNTIFWQNSAPNSPQILNAASMPTLRYSLIQNSGGSGAGWDTTLGVDGGGNVDADPLFVSADNGDFRLWAASPAIDNGDNDGCPLTDIRGLARPVDGDGNGDANCDMGVYEFVGTQAAIGAGSSYEQLTWVPQAPNDAFQIWRSTSPYFNPAQGEGVLLDSEAAGPYEPAEGGMGQAQTNYFYLLWGERMGETLDFSNRLGEFDFALAPGS